MYIEILKKLALPVMTILFITYLGYRVTTLRSDLLTAEANTLLVVSEFDKLYKSNVNLQKDFNDQELLYKYNIYTLKAKHKRELIAVVKINTIKQGILNVKDTDDGGVATILTDTINALRLLD